MTRTCFTAALAFVVLASVPHAAHGQAGRVNAKLDSLQQVLRPFIPNRGTLSMIGGDTLVYEGLIAGKHRIPLDHVEVLVIPDSSLAGFRCYDEHLCILHDPGPRDNVRGTQLEERVVWAIGSMQPDRNRQPVFEGDVAALKRVATGLTGFIGDRPPGPRWTGGVVGSASPSSIKEMAVRENAGRLMTLPESRWTQMFFYAPVTIAVDLTGARTEYGYRVAWVRTTFAPMQKMPEGLVSMVFAEQRFDCAVRRTQVLQTVLVIPPREAVARARPPGENWTPVTGNAPVLAILEKVCATGG